MVGFVNFYTQGLFQNHFRFRDVTRHVLHENFEITNFPVVFFATKILTCTNFQAINKGVFKT